MKTDKTSTPIPAPTYVCQCGADSHTPVCPDCHLRLTVEFIGTTIEALVQDEQIGVLL